MAKTNADRARILIIDDEASVRKILGEILGFRYECEDAACAEEALARLARQEFDLVISDINMPGVTGLELTPQVLSCAPDTVVVMISGETTVERAIAAMRAGAFDYITKPFDFSHVEAIIERALNHRALLKEKREWENNLEKLVARRTAQLEHLAYHDQLTGLPNRNLFEERLRKLTRAAPRRRRQSAVLLLTIDCLANINDSLGHAVGDKLLRAVAERLTENGAARGVTVARFEGGEFALLVSDSQTTEMVAEFARRIREALEMPFLLAEHEIFITFSMGVSLFPADGKNAETLLKNAGAALYRAKEVGGNNCQFYKSDMNAKALNRLRLESNLRRALEREEFVIYYQPQVETDTLRMTGVEALVRWQPPGQELTLPSEFIPLAEDTGLIVALGEWVLRKACAQNKAWQDAGFPPLRVSVNLSARHFQQQDILQTIRQVLDETKLRPFYLELELTESSLLRNSERVVRTLRELKTMGVAISIDDFGTGYSSLGYLKQLPIDKLKIDRSFVQDVTTAPDNAALVMAIIMLTHNLRLGVIAEGVETEEQRRLLHLLRCDELQGFLFSEPLPVKKFERLLSEMRDGANFVPALDLVLPSTDSTYF
jgi:diguanylate cyclase (GGDEF)-like protein